MQEKLGVEGGWSGMAENHYFGMNQGLGITTVHKGTQHGCGRGRGGGCTLTWASVTWLDLDQR